MGFFKEFRGFISKGNVVDLAVGIIIGAAFGKIVASLVADVIMPPIGFIMGGVNFTELKIPIKNAETDAAGKVVKAAVSINYGNFIQACIEFVIIAFAVFLLVKAISAFRRKQEAAPEAAPAPTRQEELLSDIKTILERNSGLM